MTSGSFPELAIGYATTDPRKQAIREWLSSRVSENEAEELLKEHPHQFAGIAPEWGVLKRMLQEKDELWLWGAPLTCEQDSSPEGFALVRGGDVVATLALPERTALDVITGLSHQAERSWLREQTTVDEVDKRLRNGGLADQWKAMKQLTGKKDELWSFCSNADSWANLAGRAGYALVHDGQVIATIVTHLN
jgi:hypothetical protein